MIIHGVVVKQPLKCCTQIVSKPSGLFRRNNLGNGKTAFLSTSTCQYPLILHVQAHHKVQNFRLLLAGNFFHGLMFRPYLPTAPIYLPLILLQNQKISRLLRPNQPNNQPLCLLPHPPPPQRKNNGGR